MDTFLGSLFQSYCGERGTLQTNNTGMCGKCSQRLGHTGFAPAHAVCAFPVYTAQVLACSARNCLRWALGHMHFQVLATQVQVLGYSSKAQTQLGLCFVPFPRPSLSGCQVFGKHSSCNFSPPPSLPLSFLSVQPVHLLRRMSTVQNPKKSWLAMKPACSLVDDASLDLQFPPSGSGCPCLPVSSGGWASPQPASSGQSFVL